MATHSHKKLDDEEIGKLGKLARGLLYRMLPEWILTHVAIYAAALALLMMFPFGFVDHVLSVLVAAVIPYLQLTAVSADEGRPTLMQRLQSYRAHSGVITVLMIVMLGCAIIGNLLAIFILLLITGKMPTFLVDFPPYLSLIYNDDPIIKIIGFITVMNQIGTMSSVLFFLDTQMTIMHQAWFQTGGLEAHNMVERAMKDNHTVHFKLSSKAFIVLMLAPTLGFLPWFLLIGYMYCYSYVAFRAIFLGKMENANQEAHSANLRPIEDSI